MVAQWLQPQAPSAGGLRPLVSPSPLPSIFPSVGVFCTKVELGLSRAVVGAEDSGPVSATVACGSCPNLSGLWLPE